MRWESRRRMPNTSAAHREFSISHYDITVHFYCFYLSRKLQSGPNRDVDELTVKEATIFALTNEKAIAETNAILYSEQVNFFHTLYFLQATKDYSCKIWWNNYRPFIAINYRSHHSSEQRLRMASDIIISIFKSVKAFRFAYIVPQPIATSTPVVPRYLADHHHFYKMNDKK